MNRLAFFISWSLGSILFLPCTIAHNDDDLNDWLYNTNDEFKDSKVLENMHAFPDVIPHFSVRKDVLSGEEVSRGRLDSIGINVYEMMPPDTPKQREQMVPFKDMYQKLQCASSEPEMNGNRGILSMIKMARNTTSTESLKTICAFLETKCQKWPECAALSRKFEKGDYNKEPLSMVKIWGELRTAHLMRVMNNSLYYDWPWGVDRFDHQRQWLTANLLGKFKLVLMVIRTVKDIGDSVFFFGHERYFLPKYVPFPSFSFGPNMESSDMPVPWNDNFEFEFSMQRRAYRAKKNFTDEFYYGSHPPWEQRQSRAAFFSSWLDVRHLVYDAAAMRGDLFDVTMKMAPHHVLSPWNPASDEPNLREPDVDPLKRLNDSEHQYREQPGFVQPLTQFKGTRTYTPHHYKYVIVFLGSSGMSTANRLATLVAHSGAVILLQESSYSYHFSARMTPWVHYVPISHTGADLIAKVEWLRQHDDKARQLALNAQNFGKSFLRMEDYYCYMAHALRIVSAIQKKTNVTTPFNAQKLHGK